VDDSVSIRIKPPGGSWETVGTGRFQGVVPENLELTANDWGPDTASFDLRRDPGSLFPDLHARSQIEIEVGGVVVWGGRLKETPSRDGDDPIINVQARGWQYHLDDDAYSKLYAHSRLADWADVRSNVAADLADYTQNIDVGNDGVITMGYRNGSPVTSGKYGGVYLIAPEDSPIKKVVLTWTLTAAMDSRIYIYGYNSMADLGTDGNASGTPEGSNVSTNALTSGTLTHTFTTPRRYVAIFLYRNGVTGTAGQDHIVRISSVLAVSDAAYESGNASILKAHTVILDALTRAPLLSSDTSRIATTSFSIPDFSIPATEPKTPREVMEAANAFHNYRLLVDANGRLVFEARPSVALFEVGAWEGSTFEDSSMNSDEDVYNKVIVVGTGADGTPVVVERTATAPLLARTGETRTKILPVQAPLTTTTANQIGDTYLQAHTTTPLKGTLRIQGQGGMRDTGGRPVHPSELLLNTGQLVRLTNRIDPDTGGVGRDGRIAQVTYRHNDRTAEVQIDNDRRSFEAFMHRLGALTQVSVGGA
jgi:hypothetical protein